VKSQAYVVGDVSSRLAKLQIPFMLTGSMAMNQYAMPRMTRDIDFVLDMKPSDGSRLVETFEDDYFVQLEAVESALKHRSMFNLIHNETVLKVDCILLKNSDYARTEFQRRKPLAVRDEDMSLDFQTVIVTKEDLILAKLRWMHDSRSETQQKDVKNLLQSGYDQEYVNHWAEKMALQELLARCQGE
jgi:hypothetical protein